MADDERKQTLVSDEACRLALDGGEAKEIQEGQFIYAQAASADTEVGHDILQQALNEAENVIEGSDNVQQQTDSVPDEGGGLNNVSDAQSLLNTLTGENVSEVPENVGGDIGNLPESSTVSEFVQETVDSGNGEKVVEAEDKTQLDNKVTEVKETTKPSPLGSSQNPIHIIQQGNTYHSSQDLTKGQLHQIAQVLHKQQIVQALKNGGSSVVYNPDTNTRIVYRVVTPSEALGKNSNLLTRQSGVSLLRNSSSSSSSAPTPVKRGRGRPRKDGSSSGPTSTPSRGRGRGRKPSRVDDQDVGREPVKLTKEELELRKKHRPRTRSGRISKPPSFMVKEYKRIHPLDYHDDEDDIAEKSDGGYSDYELSENDDEDSNLSSNLTQGDGDESKDGIPKSEQSSKNSTDDAVKTESPQPTVTKITKHRGRPPLSEAEKSNKRKTKLREAMSGCSNSEIIDVVLPHVLADVPAWDYILQKTSENSKINMCEVYKTFQTVLSKIQKCLTDNLQQVVAIDTNETEVIDIPNSNVGALFGVTEGKYSILNQESVENTASKALKRTRDESFDKPNSDSKRLKLDWSGTINLASGVDLSISEVQTEDEVKKPSDEPIKSNVSIISSNDMEVVSIGPVTDEMNEDAPSEQLSNCVNEVSDQRLSSEKEPELVEDSNKAATNDAPPVQVLEFHEEGNQKSNDLVNQEESALFTNLESNTSLENNTNLESNANQESNTADDQVVTAMETSPVKADMAEDSDNNLAETVENIRAEVSKHELSSNVQIVELNLPESPKADEGGQEEEVSEVINTNEVVADVSDQQTITLLMDNKDVNQEFVSDGQTVVGVIEQPQDDTQAAEAVTTESLLGYLGEQLSAEALQPGNIVIIQNPDGTTTTVALSGAEGKEIPMETVQALLAMDPSAQQQIE